MVHKELHRLVPTEAGRRTECGLSAPDSSWDCPASYPLLYLAHARGRHVFVPEVPRSIRLKRALASHRSFPRFTWPATSTISQLSKPDHYIFMWSRAGSRHRNALATRNM